MYVYDRLAIGEWQNSLINGSINESTVLLPFGWVEISDQ
jgi:hypothetical protein